MKLSAQCKPSYAGDFTVIIDRSVSIALACVMVTSEGKYFM